MKELEKIILSQDLEIQNLWKIKKELEEELEKYKWLYSNEYITYTSDDVKRCKKCNRFKLKDNLAKNICNKCLEEE